MIARYRRERVPVTTMLWDLYGSRQAELLSDRVQWLGRPEAAGSSRVVYRRVNLRAMAAGELLERGFKTLYALVPLTRDGADAEVVRRADGPCRGLLLVLVSHGPHLQLAHAAGAGGFFVDPDPVPRPYAAPAPARRQPVA